MGPPGQRWVRLSGFWRVPPFLALVEPVAVAVHLQDVDMVGETIQQRPGQAFGTEHLCPLIERQIGCHQGMRDESGEEGDVLASLLQQFTAQIFVAGVFGVRAMAGKAARPGFRHPCRR